MKGRIVHLLILGTLAALSGGCQTSRPEGEPTTMMLPDRDDESSADGAAYTADSMHFRKPMPSHPHWRPSEFYYQKCSNVGSRSYYSKTSYACETGAP